MEQWDDPYNLLQEDLDVYIDTFFPNGLPRFDVQLSNKHPYDVEVLVNGKKKYMFGLGGQNKEEHRLALEQCLNTGKFNDRTEW